MLQQHELTVFLGEVVSAGSDGQAVVALDLNPSNDVWSASLGSLQLFRGGNFGPEVNVSAEQMETSGVAAFGVLFPVVQ